MYKKRTHEGGIATPFIVKWPAHIDGKGGIQHQPGHIIDIMATICDVANVTYPKTFNGHIITPLPGKSFRPLLEGEIREDNRTIFWEHIGNRAVRQGDWKLVAREGEAWELYNLSLDRSETNNLIEEEPELAAQLQQTYENWAGHVGVN